MNETLGRSPSDDRSIQNTENEQDDHHEGNDDQSPHIEGLSLHIKRSR